MATQAADRSEASSIVTSLVRSCNCMVTAINAHAAMGVTAHVMHGGVAPRGCGRRLEVGGAERNLCHPSGAHLAPLEQDANEIARAIGDVSVHLSYLLDRIGVRSQTFEL